MTAPSGGHQRIYRSLLRLYPADYRQTYGDQMVQLFGDQLREDGGRAWLTAPVDVISTAASEHLRRNRPMAHSLTLAPTPVARLLGMLGVLGGAVLLAAFVIEIAPEVNWLRLALFNVGAIAVAIGAHRVQASASPLLTLSATILVVVTNSLYLLTVLAAEQVEIPRLGLIYVVIGGAMWLSDLWFGLVTFRLRVLSRWAALALIVGSGFAFIGMGAFGLTVPGTPLNAVIMTGLATHGLGWILLGLDVALRRQPAVA